MLGALGNPHRLTLFRRLTRCCSPGTQCAVDASPFLTVGQVGDGLDIAPSTLSHHLKTLNQAGLVRTKRHGKQVLCWIEPQVLADLSEFFAEPLRPQAPPPSAGPPALATEPQNV